MTVDGNRNENDEMLMALADGELTGPDAAHLRARIAADPDLAARYALFTRSATALREAMDTGPVPDHLIAAVLRAPDYEQASAMAQDGGDDGAEIMPLRRRTAPAGMITGRVASWSLALAASLMLSFGLGSYLGRPGSAPAIGNPQQAAAALSATVTGGSVTLADGSTARALSSFETELGLCRLIAVETATGQADRALVCRQPGAEWQTALVVNAGDSDEFSLASDLAVSVVDDFLDTISAGAPLSADAEARALAP